ncbi:MAG: hypothetical protein LBS21_14340 [Clostridiales bacterium]|nr:hypothetical protein [Clostridiales bacterium]
MLHLLTKKTNPFRREILNFEMLNLEIFQGTNILSGKLNISFPKTIKM